MNSTTNSLKSRLVSAEETLAIRQTVLWPDLPVEAVRLNEDRDGIHFGLFRVSATQEEHIGVASFFPNENAARLRKMAILPAFQGQGCGARLFDDAIADLKARGIENVWCDIRLSAAGFYSALGFEIADKVFLKEGVEYLKARKELC